MYENYVKWFGKKYQLRRSLRLRRAWTKILKSDDPDQVTRLAGQMLQRPLALPRGFARLAGVPQSLLPAAERCVRQVLAERLYADLQPDLMLALAGKRTGIPVPRPWRIWLRAQGLNIHTTQSILQHSKLILWSWIRGVRCVWTTSKATYLGALPQAPNGPYDLFLNLPNSMFPQHSAKPESQVVAWLAARDTDVPLWLQTPLKPKEGTNWVMLPTPLPAFPGPKAYIYFLVLSARAVIVSLCAALLGQGGLALILNDLIRLAHARAIGPTRLARRYVAENSRWFYRPLFSEWAQQSAKSESILLFYATNMDSVLQLAPNPCPPCFLPGYEMMSWDGYMVWDTAQGVLVAAWGKDPAQVSIVGPVPLGDIDAPLPLLPARSIAVFDVSPHRPAYLAQIGLVPAYYLDEIAARFLTDLLAAAKANGAHLVLKQKRAQGSHLPPQYRLALNALLADPDVHVLDPGYSASRVVAACAATISMPFSSPSLFAHELGLPTAFYDPTGPLIATDRQTHGLPTLHGFTALNDWMQTTLDGASSRRSTKE